MTDIQRESFCQGRAVQAEKGWNQVESRDVQRGQASVATIQGNCPQEVYASGEVLITDLPQTQKAGGSPKTLTSPEHSADASGQHHLKDHCREQL